jgi:hypothetical protein
MSFAKNLLLASTILASTALPASATTLYANPAGSDNNSCLSPQTACKTITHTAAVANGGDTVVPAGGTYFETAKISKSGTGTHSIIRIVPAPYTYVYIDGSHGAAGTNAVEVTASYIQLIGLHILNAKNDGVYVHGTDATHPATDVRLDQLNVHNNGNHGTEALHVSAFELGYGFQYSSGHEGVFLTDAPNYNIHDMNVWNSGSPPVTGTKVIGSPGGNYEGNDGLEVGNHPTLDLENSPRTNVANNQPNASGGRTPTCCFTFVVNPPSDLATDTFTNNGPNYRKTVTPVCQLPPLNFAERWCSSPN